MLQRQNHQTIINKILNISSVIDSFCIYILKLHTLTSQGEDKHIYQSITSAMQHFPGCISTTPYDVLLCAFMTYDTWPVWYIYLPVTNRMHVNLSRTYLSHSLLNYRVIHKITDSLWINGSTVTARCTGLYINNLR